jgi:hypothetical protein
VSVCPRHSFVTGWKEGFIRMLTVVSRGFMNMFNSSFTWSLLPRLFRGAFGMRDPPASDSDGFMCLFGVG